MIVSDPTDVRYLSGFRGEDAMLLVGPERAMICTDSRFWAQVHDEVSDFELVKTDLLLTDVVKAAAEAFGDDAVLGFQGEAHELHRLSSPAATASWPLEERARRRRRACAR